MEVWFGWRVDKCLLKDIAERDRIKPILGSDYLRRCTQIRSHLHVLPSKAWRLELHLMIARMRKILI